MKKIGFVDYYISEWHANNYPAWIKSACEELGCDYTVAYAWAEKDISPVDGKSTDEWCKEFGAQKCQTIEELCSKSDVILVLSPSNPEKHLEYAEKVLKFGKRTYIDKTFAPNIDHAKKIFDIAKEYNAPFFSSSALRYATELDDLSNPDEVIVTGSGGSVDEYIIHQIEMVVKKLGVGADSVTLKKVGREYCFFIDYLDNRSALMNYGNYGFGAFLRNDEKCVKSVIRSDFFKGLIKDIVNFYETGKISFDTKETLEAIAIRDAVLTAVLVEGEKIKVVR